MARKRTLAYAVSAIAIAIACFSTTSTAWAQDAQTQTDEIVVTATHRASSIQDVPFSVNAQTAEDLERTGSQSIEDLSRNVAGMSVQNLGPGQSQVSLRGVSAGLPGLPPAGRTPQRTDQGLPGGAHPPGRLRADHRR